MGIFLLFCLVSPILVSYSWYILEKREVRKEIKRRIISGMGRENLVLLTFTADQAGKSLRWEHAGEFEYKNQMYDVVEKETVGDTTFYWCFCDTRETTLNNQIKELASKSQGHNPQNRDNQKRLLTFLQTIFLPNYFSWDPDDSRRDRQVFQTNHFLYASVFVEPLVPPPRNS